MPTSNDLEHDAGRNGTTQHDDLKTSDRSRISVIIEDFSFLWFTISMNTGILSIIMHQLPYQFKGLGVLSTIMFVFNIVLFAIFFVILLLRMILYPKAIANAIKSNPVELSMTGAVPIAWFTLTAQVGLTASTASWGGTATDAVTGALIVLYSRGVDARLAVPVIIVSYILVGIGFFVATLVYAAFFVRLIIHGPPAAAQSPSLVLLVGPCGQSAAAIQLLGTAATKYFGTYAKGTYLQATAGQTMSAVGVLFGLLFIGLGLWMTMFAWYLIIEAAFKKQLSYSLQWWGTLFPMATVNTAWIAFATEMDSPTFRTLAAIFLILLFINFFINCGFTIRDIWMGKLLNGSRSENPANGRVKES